MAACTGARIMVVKPGARCGAGINVREARDAIIAAHGNSLALASFHVLFEMTGWGALASC